ALRSGLQCLRDREQHHRDAVGCAGHQRGDSAGNLAEVAGVRHHHRAGPGRAEQERSCDLL
ncbi:hypothetical protein LTR66_004272, partial [Elasticomyces elasticus]